MTVAARSADSAPESATLGLGPDHPADAGLRLGATVAAGTYPYDGPDRVTDWHFHDMHQIEYAFEGSVSVETASARYVLPPHQAVWIPARLAHRTILRRVRTVSVFFAPSMIALPDAHAVSLQ